MVKASSTSGSSPLAFSRLVKLDREGTELTRIGSDAGGFLRIAKPLIAGLVQRSVDAADR